MSLSSTVLTIGLTTAFSFYCKLGKFRTNRTDKFWYIHNYNIEIMNEPSELTFKFIIVGSTGVGKSCLLLRYTKNQFTSTHYATIGMEFFSKRVVLNDVLIKLQIWDTAGQETFKSIVRNFYKNSEAAFIVYSIADRQSFNAVA